MEHKLTEKTEEAKVNTHRIRLPGFIVDKEIGHVRDGHKALQRL